MNYTYLTEKIKQKALELGFSAFGVAKLELPPKEIEAYEKWLDAHYHGTMNYLKEHLPLKKDPRALVPTATYIISVALFYKSEDCLPNDPDHGYFSMYARGRDYHKVIKNKLKRLATEIQNIADHFEYRAFVDSGPIFEKLYAQEAALGIKGKNSLVINEKLGSYFFLGELLTNLPLEANQRSSFNPCKSCTKCIDHCPTSAILDHKQINANRCIAYLTIEYKGIIDYPLTKLMGNHVYGCDLCQSCCPWNTRRIYTKEPDFANRINADFTHLSYLISLSEKEFLETFHGSCIRRIGYESFLRNVIIAISNSQNKEYLPTLTRLLQETSSPILEQHLKWAIQDLS